MHLKVTSIVELPLYSVQHCVINQVIHAVTSTTIVSVTVQRHTSNVQRVLLLRVFTLCNEEINTSDCTYSERVDKLHTIVSVLTTPFTIQEHPARLQCCSHFTSNLATKKLHLLECKIR